jgi:hypothetical protein
MTMTMTKTAEQQQQQQRRRQQQQQQQQRDISLDRTGPPGTCAILRRQPQRRSCLQCRPASTEALPIVPPRQRSGPSSEGRATRRRKSAGNHRPRFERALANSPTAVSIPTRCAGIETSNERQRCWYAAERCWYAAGRCGCRHGARRRARRRPGATRPHPELRSSPLFISGHVDRLRRSLWHFCEGGTEKPRSWAHLAHADTGRAVATPSVASEAVAAAAAAAAAARARPVARPFPSCEIYVTRCAQRQIRLCPFTSAVVVSASHTCPSEASAHVCRNSRDEASRGCIPRVQDRTYLCPSTPCCMRRAGRGGMSLYSTITLSRTPKVHKPDTR